jgi:hypothetical protein
MSAREEEIKAKRLHHFKPVEFEGATVRNQQTTSLRKAKRYDLVQAKRRMFSQDEEVDDSSIQALAQTVLKKLQYPQALKVVLLSSSKPSP